MIPLDRPCVIQHGTTGAHYYFENAVEAMRSPLAKFCTPPSPWDARDSERAVYDKQTREVVWLLRPEDPTPTGKIMQSELGKYGLMSPHTPFHA